VALQATGQIYINDLVFQSLWVSFIPQTWTWKINNENDFLVRPLA